MGLTDKIYASLPHFFQNGLISLFNYQAYKKRYGGNYKQYLELFKKNRGLALSELKAVQEKRYSDFIIKSKCRSPFYKNLFFNVESPEKLVNLNKLPLINKQQLRKQLNDVYTTKQGIYSKTGGTTGTSLEVVFTNDNMQERFAMLDDFRSRFGYKLGKKTAWFSGKSLLTERDLNRSRFWKTDYLYRIRYYSTFHIKDQYLKYYVENLIKFKPQYLVGFPSSLLEIAKYGINNNYEFPFEIVKAIFPTAETITDEMRFKIEKFFHAPMYNQYASSEGAPFIFECQNRKLHLELQSGVFEVLDSNNNPAKSGKLVVTSFTTEGTPLIRYDIGDSVVLSDNVCNCGNNNPLVKEILGRIDDYVYSPENGKINLGNVSNTLKGIKGVEKFQVIQNQLNEIKIILVIDNEIYNSEIEEKFLENWRDRIGNKMNIKLEYTNTIESEVSGKFRMVKNNIKHLLFNE